ncbi:MAG TPA: NAD-dependent succinate-semialdehyde dehydrogenase [Acidimicrobiia bacterium]|nr:NAD-dependent succinate-semialdehyde dehydrogenase [Acidimicrobiia bacterium]
MTLLDRMLADHKTGLYVGGQWLVASDGSVIEVRDPATEDVVAEVASASVEDGLSAVTAAHEAFGTWAETAPRVRGEILRRAFEMMTDREKDYAELIVTENGKAFSDAIGEVRYGAEFFRWFSEEAVRNRGEMYRSPSGDKRVFVLNQPIGVSLLVTPWNFPIAMGTRKIGPALAAGCTVVLKPASDTPLVALALADLLEEAGCPPGVVNVVPSARSGKVVGVMMADRRVRKLSFTGSTEVGKVLLAEASKRVLSTSMELGGNAPFLVLADADLDAAVTGAMQAKMRNAGEACTAANRFYVESPVADEFADRLSAAMESLVVGSGMEEGVEVGPLINAASRDKVAELVEEAATSGTITTGGKAPQRKGYFYLPTVIKDVARGAGILATEIFGPVAPIVRFGDVDDAIEQANDTDLGLISYVFTRDERRGMMISERLESGMVALNRGLISDPATPFGGVKESGLGREGSHHGIHEFLEPKYIGTNW